MRLGERGQQTGAIATVVAVIGVMIVAWVGVHVLSNVETGLPTLPRTTFSNDLLNTDLSDNTLTSPDNWENLTEPSPSYYITNAWNASGYLTVTRTDNGDNMENGVWYQALTISTTHDAISSATTSFEYRVIDNDNAGSIVVRAQLCNGTDNTTLFVDNVTADESASWTAVENDVSSVITTTGTYTLYLRAEINPTNNYGAGTSAIVGFDDANISVSTYARGYAENSFISIQRTGWGGYPLIGVVVIILVAALIIGLMIRFGGGV